MTVNVLKLQQKKRRLPPVQCDLRLVYNIENFQYLGKTLGSSLCTLRRRMVGSGMGGLECGVTGSERRQKMGATLHSCYRAS